MRDLAEGGHIDREPVLFIGDCGTGKTPICSLASAWRHAWQKRRVRFTTARAAS
jgi:hypothetical protein